MKPFQRPGITNDSSSGMGSGIIIFLIRRTLQPARSCQSVTVIAREGIWADGLDTGIFVMGVESGMQLVEALPDVEAIIVDHEGSCPCVIRVAGSDPQAVKREGRGTISRSDGGEEDRRTVHE